MVPMFITVLFSSAKIWKQPKFPSTYKQIKKWYICMWYICTTVLRIKNEILSFAAKWMDLESIMLSEISQRKKKNV